MSLREQCAVPVSISCAERNGKQFVNRETPLRGVGASGGVLRVFIDNGEPSVQLRILKQIIVAEAGRRRGFIDFELTVAAETSEGAENEFAVLNAVFIGSVC